MRCAALRILPETWHGRRMPPVTGRIRSSMPGSIARFARSWKLTDGVIQRGAGAGQFFAFSRPALHLPAQSFEAGTPSAWASAAAKQNARIEQPAVFAPAA